MVSRRVAQDVAQKTEFARWLTNLRLDIGSQSYVAQMMGVTRVTLSRWETAQNLPDGEHIPLIAKTLGVSEQEVSRRAGYAMASEVSDFSLSLARLIETKTAGLPPDRLQAVSRGIDAMLTAFAPMASA